MKTMLKLGALLLLATLAFESYSSRTPRPEQPPLPHGWTWSLDPRDSEPTKEMLAWDKHEATVRPYRALLTQLTAVTFLLAWPVGTIQRRVARSRTRRADSSLGSAIPPNSLNS